MSQPTVNQEQGHSGCGSYFSSLFPYSNAIGHPARAGKGILGYPVRIVRKALKALFRPWLDIQTRFNHAVIRTLEYNEAALSDRIESIQNQLAAKVARADFQELACKLQELRIEFIQTFRIQESRAATQYEQLEEEMRSRLEEHLVELDALVTESLRRQSVEIESRWAERLEAALTQAESRWEQFLTQTNEEWKERLQHAEETAVNRELSHLGMIAQSGLFFNPPIHVNLCNGQGRVMGISERILEHIFVHNRLPRETCRVLDLGSAESTNAIEMASLGFDVVGVDMRLLPLSHPNFQMVQANLADLPFADESFDLAVSLSTIEHVGLTWYGNVDATTSDQAAIDEVSRVLKPGSKFIVTVPYGRAGETPVHRIYDRKGLENLFNKFTWTEVCYGLRDENNWTFSQDEEKASQTDSLERVNAIAMLVLEKPNHASTL